MRGEGDPADFGDEAAASGQQRSLREERRQRVKQADAEPRMGAEQPRRRADADDRVVARVLQRVDRVVADRPTKC